MFPRILSAALLLFASNFASAQAPSAPDQLDGPGLLKLSTHIVVLDVVVTDKQGNLVTRDLTRDDFTIVEDKLPQTIRSFDPPSAHLMPQGVIVSSSADLKKIADAPVTLLVLDELNTRFEDMSYARNSMVKYLQAQPAVMKQPTVLLLATNTSFVQLHDYTQNRDELITLIKKHMPEYPRKMMAGNGGGAAVERMAQSLASLEQIAQASQGTPGRKNILWVGNGFPSTDLIGLDDRTAATVTAAIRRVTDMLLAARITMYTINPTANSSATLDIETPDDLNSAEAASDSGGEPFAGLIQFSNFAPATGGRSFLSRNDINNEIAEGIDQGNNYYTLSYAPSNKSEDAAKYRNILIVMKDKNLHATTRNGYYPPTAATRNVSLNEPPRQAKAQLQMDLSNAVNSAITYNGLDVKATRAGDTYVLKVKSSGLDWSPLDPSAQKTEVTVMAAWYTDKAKLLGHAAKELNATRPSTTDPDNPGETSFTLPVTVPPGAARLRFVVRDAINGHMGTVDLKP